jgi:outer membrane cobalamin receptor
MPNRSIGGCLSLLVFAAGLRAQVAGKVVDPTGAAIAGAQVALMTRTGLESQTVTAPDGTFQFPHTPPGNPSLVVTAPGFRTQTTAPGASVTVQMEIAPRVDMVGVVGSAIDATAAEQGGDVSIVSSRDFRERNEPYAIDLLRYLPGLAVNQSGSAGAVTSIFMRGGGSKDTLVQIDGVPVNWFGGGFDFAHIPAEAIDHVEVIRGAQSSVYGSYANSGVIDFVTRQAQGRPHLEVLAEGGTYIERRFGVTGSGTVAGFGIAASASRSDSDGPVANSDYRNEDVLLNVTRRFGRQRLSLHGDFDSNEVGEPGPWGSNPKGVYTGIDRVSRGKNNFSDYLGRYEVDVTERVREELTGSYFLENSGYRSPYGFSFAKYSRAQGDARTVVSVSAHDVAAVGFTAANEQMQSTYVADASFDVFPLSRYDISGYAENRFQAGRVSVNAGVRADWIRTGAIPTDGYSRPFFPENTLVRVNPKIAGSFALAPATRAHASFGMGIRPPDGFELAFTNNPGLKPERTRSVDGGIEQRLFHDLVLLDATYFYNRYYDLIVTLGGNLATLSRYQSANLANSRAQGAEFSASVRPSRTFFLTGSYTLLQTRILSLEGSNSLAPLPFQVGQPLTRRPRNSGSVVATYTRGRVSADVTGYFRGTTLFEEPNYGASNGLYWDPAFANVGLNLNYRLAGGVTLYGHLRNALNRHYEEIYGFPSPRLNFVAGLKWVIQ